MLQDGIGEPRRALALGEAHAGAALHDGLVEQALGARHGEEGADLSAAARLAEDRDVAGIAAEAGGMLAHPFERGDEIEQAGIARLGEALAVRRQVEMAEDVEPVIDRDDHDVVAPREVHAVVARRVGRAVGEGAAMQPDQDRALAVVEAGRPDMQRQAVLADRQGVDRAPDRRQLRPLRCRRRLRRAAGIGGRLAHARPRLGLARRHEAVGAGGRGAVGNALEDMHAAGRETGHAARRRLHDRRLHAHIDITGHRASPSCWRGSVRGPEASVNGAGRASA